MAQSNAVAAPHTKLEPQEKALVELASRNDPADAFSFSDKESQILDLYDRIFEQQLEEALLTQDTVGLDDVEDIDGKLAEAERELLETRATLSVRQKVVEGVLMTEPSIQAVYSVPTSPIDKTLLPLINRRDALSLAYENLAQVCSSCLEKLSNAEVENTQITEENQELVQSLLQLTNADKLGEPEITDPQLKEELEELETETKQKKADYVRNKRIISASIVASGVDWASDEKLEGLVLDDELADDT